MLISFDSIQPTTSVTVTISPGLYQIAVKFARVLDHDVVKDMQVLKSQPFVKFFFGYPNEHPKMFDVTVDSNYPLETVAEAIAQMLEGHGLKVKRQANLDGREEVDATFITQ